MPIAIPILFYVLCGTDILTTMMTVSSFSPLEHLGDLFEILATSKWPRIRISPLLSCSTSYFGRLSNPGKSSISPDETLKQAASASVLRICIATNLSEFFYSTFIPPCQGHRMTPFVAL